MEGLSVKFGSLRIFTVLFLALQMSCSAKFVKYDKAEDLKTNSEFENSVTIVKSAEPTPEVVIENENTNQNSKGQGLSTTKSIQQSESAQKSDNKKVDEKKIDKKSIEASKKSKNSPKKYRSEESKVEEINLKLKREPELEDDMGFIGRRPAVDPFRVGEEVIHRVSYFKVKAGTLKLKVEPFAFVNNKKAYSFITEINSSSVFSTFYSVEDRVESLVDYDTLSALTYALHVKESGQLREGRAFFNYETSKASYWEKKYTEKKGHEEKKQEWELLPFSQNVFSAIFYMRVFQWSVGKQISFRVSHDNETIIFKGTAVRKETIETDAGTFEAYVIKPEISVRGAFKPVGDIFFWLSADDRKYVLRIESNIKIGTLVSEVVEIKSGK
jgi:hypothetical protein